MFRSIGLGRLLTLCTGLHYSVKPTIASTFDNTLIISVNGEVSYLKHLAMRTRYVR